MTTTNVTGRQRLWAALSAAALGGAVLGAPAAAAAPDPCAASAVTDTVGKVSDNASAYLKAHPQTDRVITRAMQQQSGPQSLMTLKNHFEANPKVAADMQEISEPLTGLTTKCQLPISLPQLLGLVTAAQNQPTLPGAGTLPGTVDVLGQTGRLPGPAVTGNR